MSLKKKVRFGAQPVGRPTSDINVTPLVDVVLVLLIIFMVVTPLLEKDIEVRVPDDTEEVSQEDVPQNQLVVSLDAQGNISINNEKIADNDYVNRLRRMLAAKSDDKTVFFTADDKANYGKFVTALDGAKKAGADPLGMVTEPLPAAAAAAAPGGGAPPAPPPSPAP